MGRISLVMGFLGAGRGLEEGWGWTRLGWMEMESSRSWRVGARKSEGVCACVWMCEMLKTVRVVAVGSL